MSQMKDGGQAFPRVVEQHNGYMRPVEGMTLRDYFAAKAMLAIASNEQGLREDPSRVADCAYILADAMLKAREANHE